MKIKDGVLYTFLGLATTISIIYLIKIIAKPKKVIVKGSYKANNCDELHAFESTHGKVIGGMNTKVNSALEDFYKKGFNPDITDIKVNMDSKNMQVNWEVTIEKSKDKIAWIGLTSRGASGDNAYQRANGKSVEQDADSILKKLKIKYSDNEIVLTPVFDFLYNLDKNGKYLGKCPTRQIFYKYSKPENFPNLK